MEEVQRNRDLEAMAEMAVDWGAGAVTVSHVVGACRCPRRTANEIVRRPRDKACLLAAFDLGVERARRAISELSGAK